MTPHPASPVTDWMAIPGYRAPAEHLLGVSVPEADTEHARVIQTGVPRAFSLGWLGVLVDTAGGRWLPHRLGPGMRCPTVTMHLELVRPHVAGRDSVLVADGRPLSHGDGWALGEIVVMGAGLLPLAVGNTRFVLAESDPSAPDPPQLSGVVTGESGRADDLMTLLGVPEVEATGGRASLVFRPATVHTNPYGIVHGGLHVALVDLAMSSAIDTVIDTAMHDSTPDGAGMELLGVDVAFHRPIPVDDPVSVTATVMHRGRTAALAEATVYAGNGKPLTTARGNFGRFRTAP